jgi:hypothetical protein
VHGSVTDACARVCLRLSFCLSREAELAAQVKMLKEDLEVSQEAAAAAAGHAAQYKALAASSDQAIKSMDVRARLLPAVLPRGGLCPLYQVASKSLICLSVHLPICPSAHRPSQCTPPQTPCFHSCHLSILFGPPSTAANFLCHYETAHKKFCSLSVRAVRCRASWAGEKSVTRTSLAK